MSDTLLQKSPENSAPTTLHRDEGWWWAQDMREKNGPVPTRVTRYQGALEVQMFGWEYAVAISRCEGIEWWGRIAPGVPPTANEGGAL